MKFCLIGEKLGHSFSVPIHRFYGAEYELREIARDSLGDFVKNCPFDGFNVTIPYKTEIMRYLDEVDPRAAKIFVIIIYIVSKWMDIKKYQETWARHYFHHHLLNHEIIQYVYELGDYSNKNDFDSKYIFINKFLAIENLNMEKFVANLENKEIRIGDWPELLRRIIK